MPIELTERFIKQYARLPRTIQQKVDKALALLDADFRHPGLRSHPIESAPGVIEAYVDRKYRMTFERHGDSLIMRNVDNHDDCLRQPWDISGLDDIRCVETEAKRLHESRILRR